MSYVYMKALESAPERYDSGINLLGWGRLDEIRDHIADIIEDKGGKVLEIGVGTGTQALLLAERGLEVIGFDQSAAMLSIAQKKLDAKRREGTEAAEIVARIELQKMAAVQLDELPSNSFNVVTSTLVFSELYNAERKYVLAHTFRILKPGGILVLADEVIPSARYKRWAHALIAAPLKFFTYLVTQTLTKPVQDLSKLVKESGFEVLTIERYQLDSFELIVARKPLDVKLDLDPRKTLKFNPIPPPGGSEFWQTGMRMIGHPTQIGLLPVGNPTPESPVLCTCNFQLTVRRLYKLLKKQQINAWVLVAPTEGINVWCAATGGKFTAESVITAIKISGLERYVSHRRIILPQLGAPGIDPKKVQLVTGWHCIWGPVHMEDLPAFLTDLPESIRNKTERQRSVRFGVKSRLEMGSALLFPLLSVLCVPLLLVLLYLNLLVWAIPLLATLILHTYLIFGFFPIIPGHLGTTRVGIGSITFLGFTSIISWVITGYFQVSFFLLFFFQGIFAMFNLWPLQLGVIFNTFILIFDIDGLTPTMRSNLLVKAWNQGKMVVFERWGASYIVTPYGIITADLEKCVGCGDCIDVCPRIVLTLDQKKKKIKVCQPDRCINCRACVIICPEGALFLKPETEAARIALKQFQAEAY